jgi:hypothetical protein
MKSFLLKEKHPILKWGSLPDNIFFEGQVPEGYQLAISPSGNYIVIDIDRHGDIDGFENIPHLIQMELDESLNYSTKNNGKHYWMYYTGSKILANKTSGLGFDLRTNKGYVVWYPDYDIRDNLDKIKHTSYQMNKWLEKHFSFI